MEIKNNSLILFQGDSITDAGRDKEDSSSLGNGYVMMIASDYIASHYNQEVTFLNKGISGNKAIDLYNRWDEDCIRLTPDLLTIFVGINDTSGDNINEDSDFFKYYDLLLEMTRKKNDSIIILMEPFVYPVDEDRQHRRKKLYRKIEIVRELSMKYKTALIPLDGIFQSVAVNKGYKFFAADGVHPSLSGHALIAREWNRKVKEL
ncbi:MAG: SGNH/GDSL hydrolase family protein [Clostridia bacterium]|nr:SGNH/GDSL hydrolase family protein [Clostridia bacterium]